MPLLLEFFVPGFIFMNIFNFLVSRKTTSSLILGSIVISYLLKALCSFAHTIVFVDTAFSWSGRVIILSVIAIISSIMCVIFYESECAHEISLRLNNKTLHDDIWQDIINYKNGTSLRIVCSDNAIYTGVLVGHEERGADSWFVIKDYVVQDSGIKYAAENITYKTRLALNLKNVKRVELFYGQPKPTLLNKLKKLAIKVELPKKNHSTNKEQEN